MNAGDTIDLYYFSNHDTISQLRGKVTVADGKGVELMEHLNGQVSFFPWTSVQRVKYIQRDAML